MSSREDRLDASDISDVFFGLGTIDMGKIDVFSALSSPVRRRILLVLLKHPATVTALVAEFDLHRPAVSEHLQVLRKARLVRAERRGREQHYHLEPQRLFEIEQWLEPFERYWRERMRALEKALDEEEP